MKIIILNILWCSKLRQIRCQDSRRVADESYWLILEDKWSISRTPHCS